MELKAFLVGLECDGVGVQPGTLTQRGSDELSCAFGAARSSHAKLDGGKEDVHVVLNECHHTVCSALDLNTSPTATGRTPPPFLASGMRLHASKRCFASPVNTPFADVTNE